MEKIKEKLNSDVILHIPNFNKEFIISCDASNYSIAAVLKQEIDNEIVPIDWNSKK